MHSSHVGPRNAPRARTRARERASGPRHGGGAAGALAPLGIVAAALLAYHNTFPNPFVFDDFVRIVNNPAVRSLWPPWQAMAGTTRPLVQLTLALNYALGGLDPWGYHAFNLAIHAAAALALFGVIRRTLAGPSIAERFRDAATPIAFVATLLWTVHPLQTQAVTYLIQRAESLAALFYLITLYAVIRGAGAARPGRWYAAAIAACALGMTSKATVATAPLVVLIYDRMFLSRSFGELWRARRALHLGLFATLALLPLLFANGPTEWRGSAGVGVQGVTPLGYALTQPGVILHYLRLCVWPHPLVLDYAWPLARSAGEALVPGVIVVGLFMFSIVASWRGHRLGFLGLWFFLVLAPTSSFIPVADLAFEHRLYLPLGAVTTLAALAGAEALRGLAPSPGATRALAATLVVLVTGTLTMLTVRRNLDYRSIEAMWVDTVAKRPNNARARTSLGLARLNGGRPDEALKLFGEALALDPNDTLARIGRGYVLSLVGRHAEALPDARAAVRTAPDNGEAHFLLGTVLLQLGELDEAAAALEEAIRLEPGRSSSHLSLGDVRERQGRWDEAIARYAEAVRLRPDDPNARRSLGLALAQVGRRDEARAQLEAALAMRPDDARARAALEGLAPPAR